ncbi:MAG: 50S ribosomal protein L10 [Anaerolineae bacterium]|nr:50S ribosomal protein L10 [Anaerolineae bacterium]
MAISRERKEELVAHYGDLLRSTSGIVVTQYKGLTVAQVRAMRDKLRDIDGKYVITKNTLFSIALREAGWPVPDELLQGPVGIAVGNGNFPAVAKMMVSFLKDYEEVLSIKGGIMEGQILNAAQVEAVSNLPSLDELRAQLAGLISQPAAGLVTVLNAGVASVAQVLQAYVTKNEAA